MKSKIQSSDRVLGAVVLSMMEVLESRELLSASPALNFAPTVNAETAAMALPFSTKSVVISATKASEFHGVLTFSALPSGIIPGVGGSTSKPAPFETPVILTIQSTKHGGVTGVLNARQLGTFEVTGTINNSQVLLKFVPIGKSESTTVASFRGASAGPNHLTGTFLEDTAGQHLHGRLRLNFIKQTDLQPSSTNTGIPVAGFGGTGTATGVSTGFGTTNTGAADTTTTVDNLVDTALGGIDFGDGTDISGTNLGLGDGGISLGTGTDISGTTPGVGFGTDINAPAFGAGGSLDISGTNTGTGSDGIAGGMLP